ncbi:SRPBCC family protein [Cryobacterium breve]|uniref:SRPBCC family protein n=2 Tax=Microbacteriaceae TaxID=85023 RepID=A0ABY2J689_9MICO|nr:SRPBCC family protein [Cryobacterium sp. TmT3-12]TFD00443.1 SRPBCC family protein [Cryobacterium breve]
MNCPPENVFAVLADGWLYPSWVVGASRMRAVDATWPEAGSGIHHSVGVWPALIDDSTSALEWDPPRHALFRARGWPVGEAHVALDVRARGNGCIVRITEDATAGPGRFVPLFLRDSAIRMRNVETLRRLAFLAEGGAGKVPQVPGTTTVSKSKKAEAAQSIPNMPDHTATLGK